MTVQDGQWVVTVHVDVSDGEVRCVGLDVHGFRGHTSDADDPPTPLRGVQLTEITSTAVRKLRVPVLLAKACADLRLRIDPGLTGDQLEDMRSAFDQQNRRYNLAHYEKVANVYSEAVASGDYPTRAVAEYFHRSGSTAKKHVETCRKIGLLRATRPGKAGGAVRRQREEDDFHLIEAEVVSMVDRDPRT